MPYINKKFVSCSDCDFYVEICLPGDITVTSKDFDSIVDAEDYAESITTVSVGSGNVDVIAHDALNGGTQIVTRYMIKDGALDLSSKQEDLDYPAEGEEVDCAEID